MDIFANLAVGFGVALTVNNLLYCFIGVFLGTADRRAARHRAGRDHRDAAAAHLQPRCRDCAHHAGGHLLRRAVRRLDHGDPGQPAGRVVGGRHHARRLPDGAAGARRSGARHRGDRLVHRRLRRDARGRAVLAAACRGRAELRAGRLLLADGARPDRRRRAGAAARCARRSPWWCLGSCSGSSAPTSIPA